ncbi:UNVERIFIED_ORG: DNA-binding NtrC family response regulator [Bacillus sp. B2I3]|nr:DNA-binding NtrC family response regulator [Bacillus sp. B2I3]
MEKQVHILIVEDDNDISGLLCNMMKNIHCAKFNEKNEW